MFSWYVAKRFFNTKNRSSGFLSFIKFMAISGIAIGAAGLLISLSIVHGFKSVIRDKILDFGPSIKIQMYSAAPIYEADTLQTWLQRYDVIDQTQSVTSGQAVVQHGNKVEGSFIRGVEFGKQLTHISDYISEGEFNIDIDSTGLYGLVLGRKMAKTLDAHIGDKITIFTIDGVPSPLNTPEVYQFRLRGIYETGIDRFDDVMTIIPLPYAQKLFRLLEDEAHAVEISLKDRNDILALNSLIEDDLGFPYYTETIYDTYTDIFSWIELQEKIIPPVIAVMIIVAAFNLIGAILMMVLERTKEIGVLITLGASRKSIKRIYIFEGLIVATIGLIIAFALSFGFHFLQSNFHIIPLDASNYYMDYAPSEPHSSDFILVIIVTYLLSFLASYIPARTASKTDAVEVISFGNN